MYSCLDGSEALTVPVLQVILHVLEKLLYLLSSNIQRFLDQATMLAKMLAPSYSNGVLTAVDVLAQRALDHRRLYTCISSLFFWRNFTCGT